MISFGTKGNLKNLVEKLKRIDNKFDSGDFLEETAKLINSSIQVRVQTTGKGINGKKLRAYSPSYAAFKKSTGRQIAYRDLTFSTRMFQSLTTSKSRNEARMFFGSAETAHIAAKNNARTPFFGVGQKEKNIINKELLKLIENL